MSIKVKKVVSGWLQLADGKNKGAVALQKRSFLEQRFPFICQATWSGKIEAKESIRNALVRECKEELGNDFYKKIINLKYKLFPKTSCMAAEALWVSYNFFAPISEKIICCAKLHCDAHKKFVFVDENTEFFPFSSKKDPKKHIVLFDDQYEILVKIFKKHV